MEKKREQIFFDVVLVIFSAKRQRSLFHIIKNHIKTGQPF